MKQEPVERGSKRWTPGFLSLANIRDVLILLFLGVLCWKLIGCELAFSVVGFEFSDLLATLLALFAVALSAMFYFNATRTSNTFYSDSNKFTRHISEIVGRLDERFGERLDSIKEVVSRSAANGGPDLQEIEEQKAEVERREEELRKQVKELMEQAKVAEDEQVPKMLELERLQEELSEAKEKLSSMESDGPMVGKTVGDVLRQVAAVLVTASPALRDACKPSAVRYQYQVMLESGEMPMVLHKALAGRGLASDDGFLTTRGSRAVHHCIEVPY
jgi:hypothetical protein